MAERRRTIASNQLPYNQPQVPSSIPRPANTGLRQSLAPQAAGRQSLAPGAFGGNMRGRASMAPSAYAGAGGGLGDSQVSSSSQPQGSQGAAGGSQFSQGHGGPPMTVSRSGHTYSSNMGGSMSVARGQGALRSSMAQPYGIDNIPGTERRTSTFRRSMAASVIATPGGGHIGAPSRHLKSAVDPRNYKTREAREAMNEDILNFCGERQFDLTKEDLKSVTQVKFWQLFEWLVKQYDPQVVFTTVDKTGAKKDQKTVVDAIIQVMQACQYPFADKVSKSHLQAPGSASNWPGILAMLHWFVVTVKARETAFLSAASLQVPAPDYHARLAAGEDVMDDAWREYTAKAYQTFLQGGGVAIAGPDGQESYVYPEEEDELRDIVNQQTETLRRCVDALRDEHDKLSREWQELSRTPDEMIAFRTRQDGIAKDLAKYEDTIEKLKASIQARAMDKQRLEGEIKRIQEGIEAKQAERTQLERIIKGQKLTPMEIQSLNADKEKLGNQIRDAQERYRNAVTRTMNFEVDMIKAIEKATALAASYEEKAQALGLLNGPVEGFEDVPFVQEINSASDSPVPEGLATQVKPALLKLRDRTKHEIREVNNQDVQVEEELTRLAEDVADLREALNQREQEVQVAKTEANRMDDASRREVETSEAELRRLEAQVASISATVDRALVEANHRYEQRNVERMAANQTTNAVRRRNRDALEQAIEQFMSYKEHMNDGTDKLTVLLDEVVASGCLAR
ncbi:kinetochore-associated Ndc80 complex subunit ndc80 [Rhodotorula toruloides]